MEVDLLAGLKNLDRVSKTGKVTRKVGMRIKTKNGGVFFDTEQKGLVAPLAIAIQEQLRENLLRGQGPSGAELPRIKASTHKRRLAERKLVDRGRADSRFGKTPKGQDWVKAVNQCLQDGYKISSQLAGKIGNIRDVNPEAPRGALSGLLANSFAVRPVRAGDGFVVFVAGSRGTPQPKRHHGAHMAHYESAIESVYGSTRFWDDKAMKQPAIRESIAQVGKAIVHNKQQKVFRELMKTFRLVSSFLKMAGT
jgi:hypothetical protein